jgi:ADP-heptose:LPS heptosyltransferase
VIVHFEAGWQLKEFPTERRVELLSLLLEAGYDPVILGAPEPAAPHLPAMPYTDLASYRALLASAESVVGCDSFPAHFSQLLGIPTVQLFGPTRTAISRGAASLRYRYLQQPLPCIPCGQISICRLDGGSSCQAQVTPRDVFAALRDLAPPLERGECDTALTSRPSAPPKPT